MRLKLRIFILSTLVIYFFVLFKYMVDKYSVKVTVPPSVTMKNRTYLIDTEGYKLPDFDPFDKTIIQYLQPVPTSIECNKGKRHLTTGISDFKISNSKRTSVIVFHEMYKNDYGVDSITCCFQAVRRNASGDSRFQEFSTHKESLPDFIYYVERKCHLLQNEITPVQETSVLVKCFSGVFQIYRNIHLFVQHGRHNKRFTFDERRGFPSDSLSVLILGLDSVSRLNEQRYMPKTLQILKKLNAIDLQGYNKMYENTYPNLMALLTGHKFEKLTEIIKRNNGFHDTIPFIWSNFSSNGYETAFGEDCTVMGMFTYNSRRGFHTSPTTHYLHPYFKASEEQVTVKKGLAWLKHDCDYCNGGQLSLENILSYSESMSKLFYQTNPYFSVLWSSSLTHDKLEMAGLADDLIEIFLSKIYNDDNWNNTIIFFMSDHGMRFGDIRKTYIGMKEENLPMMNIILPKWFNITYPTAYENLLHNQFRLTSHFDIYETLKDILNKNYENEAYLTEDHTNKNYKYTLFRKIPSQRTCYDANIPILYCSGLTATEISLTTEVMAASEIIFQTINKGLEQFPECYQLLGYQIYKSYVIEFYEEEELENKYNLYEIQIVTNPGDALLEGLIKIFIENTKLDPIIIGSVNRLNSYRGQSDCIDDETFVKYCLCKSLYP